MPASSRKKLRRATFIYWMLLLYIIAALVWWFISLEKQNKQIARRSISQPAAAKRCADHCGQMVEKSVYRKRCKRNTAKYIAEGVAFLILILIGAAICLPFSPAAVQYAAATAKFHDGRYP